jgi:hypothetical protein
MNKKLISLAVAAALVAPAAAMADATLYGKMNVSADYVDVDNAILGVPNTNPVTLPNGNPGADIWEERCQPRCCCPWCGPAARCYVSRAADGRRQ